jgi:nucleoside-diphosphate-sugar epimerase
MESNGWLIKSDEIVLVTGAAGFIGARVVACLLERGFTNVRCLARGPSGLDRLERVVGSLGHGRHVEVVEGNLLSPEDCRKAADGARVIYHLAAGTGEKSFPDAFMNSVVTTRNLLEASVRCRCLKRFVNMSSFSVYSNRGKVHGRRLDESCPVEDRPELRGEAYCYAKVKQDEIVIDLGKRYGIPYVLVRPGVAYGPGKAAITGRVGTGTFGIFLHLGGSNEIPFTYVENCAEAVVLAGLIRGVDGEVFNIVDDDLPSSREFLRLYKRNVKPLKSIYLPHIASFAGCYLWEKYSRWSDGQLPPAFNRRMWHAYWKGSTYTNEKLKQRLGWEQKVPTREGLKRYFESCRPRGSDA